MKSTSDLHIKRKADLYKPSPSITFEQVMQKHVKTKRKKHIRHIIMYLSVAACLALLFIAMQEDQHTNDPWTVWDEKPAYVSDLTAKASYPFDIKQIRSYYKPDAFSY